jgi:hypothetical protein
MLMPSLRAEQLTEAIKDYTNEKIGHSLEPFEEAVGVREVCDVLPPA